MINKNKTILTGQKEKEKGQKKRVRGGGGKKKKKEEKRKEELLPIFSLSLDDDFLEASFNLNIRFIVGWPTDLGWIGWPVHQGLNRCIGSGRGKKKKNSGNERSAGSDEMIQMQT